MSSGPARTVLRPDAGGDWGDVNAYRLLTALVVPRPIAWVSTLSADGVLNLAPHSFYTVASARPPVVQITSVGVKDTLRNVEATGEMVVNVAGRPLFEQVNHTSASVGPEVDEAAMAGLETEPSEVVAPPRVAGSPASLECRLRTTIPVGDSHLVLADVVAVTVRTDVLDGGHPQMSGLQPMSRLGGDEWGMPPEVFGLPRPR